MSHGEEERPDLRQQFFKAQIQSAVQRVYADDLLVGVIHNHSSAFSARLIVEMHFLHDVEFGFVFFIGLLEHGLCEVAFAFVKECSHETQVFLSNFQINLWLK